MATEWKPSFARVQQTHDFDDAFACIATVAGKTIEEVRALAIDTFGLPRHGPWWPTETLIQGLCGHLGWIAGPYMEATGVSDLPDMGFVLLDYNPANEIGRHAVFEKIKPSAGAIALYDPAYWVEPDKQIQLYVKRIRPPLWHIALKRSKPAG